jgi:hypothetical protein
MSETPKGQAQAVEEVIGGERQAVDRARPIPPPALASTDPKPARCRG